MRTVRLTKEQAELLYAVIGEVQAGSPEEWAAGRGCTLEKANRDWKVLSRVLEKL